MIRTIKKKDKTVHGTYKSKDMTLKLLLENKRSLADSLKHKIEIFRETDNAVLTQSFTHINDCLLKLEKDSDTYTVSFTRKLTIKKEDMDGVEKMLLEMIEKVDDTTIPMESSSSTNLLLASSASLNSLQ